VSKSKVAAEKIDLVKELLPASLRPGGMNPLVVLHTNLSKGLHSMSDEECLESAQSIREVLVFLVDQVIRHDQSSKRFTESMQKLLQKKKPSGTSSTQ
jgi:hypothetical protein